ncbi:hypothetical protein ACN28S_10685 [Cystobacter fuscus]
MSPTPSPLLQNRLEVHDRKQFELKLEYQPSGADDETRYVVETYLFLPSSLNIDAETYPRASFYGDIHNYVRFKTPVMSLEEVLFSGRSPLMRLEAALRTGLMGERISSIRRSCCPVCSGARCGASRGTWRSTARAWAGRWPRGDARGWRATRGRRARACGRSWSAFARGCARSTSMG